MMFEEHDVWLALWRTEGWAGQLKRGCGFFLAHGVGCLCLTPQAVCCTCRHLKMSVEDVLVRRAWRCFLDDESWIQIGKNVRVELWSWNWLIIIWRSQRIVLDSLQRHLWFQASIFPDSLMIVGGNNSSQQQRFQNQEDIMWRQTVTLSIVFGQMLIPTWFSLQSAKHWFLSKDASFSNKPDQLGVSLWQPKPGKSDGRPMLRKSWNNIKIFMGNFTLAGWMTRKSNLLTLNSRCLQNTTNCADIDSDFCCWLIANIFHHHKPH